MNAFTPMDAADGCEICEPCVLSTTMFSGVRLHVFSGVAHLFFYAAQPTADGRIESHLVARMVAPIADAADSRCEGLSRQGCEGLWSAAERSSFVPEGHRAN